MIKRSIYKKGRSILFQSINKKHLEKFFSSGMTDREVCVLVGISHATLYRWKKKYPDFEINIENWKAAADKQVEKSLYQLSIGYTCEETKINVIDGKIVKTKVLKHYPPDGASCMNWLTNRMHGDWKRTRQEEGKDPLTVKVLSLLKAKDKDGNTKTVDRVADADQVETSVIVEGGGMQIV